MRIRRKAHRLLDALLDLLEEIRRQGKNGNDAVGVEVSVTPGPPKAEGEQPCPSK